MRVLIAGHEAGFLLSASPALAFCDDARETLIRWRDKHGEVLPNTGIERRGYGVVIVVNRETRTFTIFAVQGGVACLLGAGGRWRDVPAPPERE